LFINPGEESGILDVRFSFAKKWLSEAKLKAQSEASRQNIFACLASLRSAIVSETEVNNLLATVAARVK